MKTLIINGQSHEGTTNHIARMLAEKLGGDTREYFLPRDFGEFCGGCGNCFIKSETLCPHYEKIKPIADAMLSADVIILASPVYVLHVTGAMKAFLDHFGYMFMVHRPQPEMFGKQAVCISTAAGAGMKSTNKDMADPLFWWGTGRIYKIGLAVASVSWEGVSDKKKSKIDKLTSSTAKKILRRKRVRPGIKTRFMYNIMRLIQKRSGWNKADTEYWEKTGLVNDKAPWKKHR